MRQGDKAPMAYVMLVERDVAFEVDVDAGPVTKKTAKSPAKPTKKKKAAEEQTA